MVCGRGWPTPFPSTTPGKSASTLTCCYGTARCVVQAGTSEGCYAIARWVGSRWRSPPATCSHLSQPCAPALQIFALLFTSFACSAPMDEGAHVNGQRLPSRHWAGMNEGAQPTAQQGIQGGLRAVKERNGRPLYCFGPARQQVQAAPNLCLLISVPHSLLCFAVQSDTCKKHNRGLKPHTLPVGVSKQQQPRPCIIAAGHDCHYLQASIQVQEGFTIPAGMPDPAAGVVPHEHYNPWCAVRATGYPLT
eukprot:1160330-Pelagomonas_calceolata.AAC.3